MEDVILIHRSLVVGLLLVSLYASILLMRYWRVLQRPERFFAIYVVTNFIFESVMLIMAWLRFENLYIFHVSALSSLIWLSLFYSEALQLTKRSEGKWLFYAIVVLLALFAIVNSSFLQGLDEVNSYSKTANQLFFIALSVYFFFESVDRPNTKRARGIFLFNTAVLIMNSASLMIYMFSNFILSSTSLGSQRLLFLIAAGINLGAQILILRGAQRLVST